MELQIVEFFKSWSCKFCDLLFSFTNILGDDLFFYLIFFLLYWLYKKEFAFKYSLVYLVNCGFNMCLKKVVGRPRPIGSTEGGYSFPSGHSQSFASVGTGLMYEAHKNNFPKKKWMRIELLVEFIICACLVGIGRMYFSQHYLTDVIAGIVLGVVVTITVTYILDIIIDRLKNSKITLDKILLVCLPILVVCYVVVALTNIISDPDDLVKIYRGIGIFASVIIGYFIDKKWIKYSTEDTAKNKFIKGFAGSAVIMVMYMLMARYEDVDAMLPVYYFIIGIVATVVLPWIFKTIKNEPTIESKEKK